MVMSSFTNRNNNGWSHCPISMKYDVPRKSLLGKDSHQADEIVIQLTIEEIALNFKIKTLIYYFCAKFIIENTIIYLNIKLITIKNSWSAYRKTNRISEMIISNSCKKQAVEIKEISYSYASEISIICRSFVKRVRTLLRLTLVSFH